MAGFEDYVRKEREDLAQRREKLIKQRQEIERQLQEIDREHAAVEAYERAKKGQGAAPSGRGGRRRTGVRQDVLEVVKRHPKGVNRAGILQEMNAKGDKKAEQSISNALSNLKKQGQVKLDQGSYTAAA